MSSCGDTDIEDLILRARELPPMTPEEREIQALSFAYGNLNASTNHCPVLSAFRNVALARGKVTAEAFDAWAAKLEWR